MARPAASLTLLAASLALLARKHAGARDGALMFTGIVNRVGVVEDVRTTTSGIRLRIGVGDWARHCSPGSSVCVSGVCLTVSGVSEPLLDFDVVPETIGKSNLGRKRPGDRLNLEPSIRVGDPIDGHFVQGHVDGTAEIEQVRTQAGEYVLRLRPESHLLPYVIPKGSIAIDGVSLTVAELGDDRFTIALIPTTLQRTNLSSLRSGDTVNVETDLLVRTIVHCWRLASGGDGPGQRFLEVAGR